MSESTRTIVSAVILAMVIRIALFEPFEIEGPSMEPTLLEGDRVVVSKYSFGLFIPFMHEALLSWGTPDPGDVVIVHSPMDNVDIVKRVVGVPGDRLAMRGGVVYRNGTAVSQVSLGNCTRDEEVEELWPEQCEWAQEKLGTHTYRISRNPDSVRRTRSEIQVEEGHIYVLGDHRDRSNDSRNLGTIPIERVKGQVLSIYWSSRNKGFGCFSPSGIRGSRMFEAVD